MADNILPVGFRHPPHNIEAEQALLGSILIRNDGFRMVSDSLRPDHFFEPAHRRIYAKISEMIDAGKLADHVTLKTSFDQDEDLRELDGAKYLSGLAEAATTVLNVVDYAREISQLATKRQIIQLAEAATTRAYDPSADESVDDQLALLERDIEWTKEHGGTSSEPYTAIDIVVASERPRPSRRWIIENFLPAGYLTLLAGDSGLGKSLLAQQMANHIAIGRDFLGNRCHRYKVMMIATEDDGDELTIRQQDINADLDINGSDLAGLIHLIPRVGFDNYLVRFLGDVGETTQAYRELERAIAETRPDVLIADNILQLMAGDPSKAEHATFFCNRMLALTRKYAVTVMLVGHVPKNSPEAGYFGSIAWKAAIRSHLVLNKHSTEKDVRVLTLPKANYAASDEDGIELSWDKGVLRSQHEDLMSYGEKLEKQMREGEIEQIFLDALDQLTSIEFSVSHARTGSKNYAPDIIVARQLNGNATHQEIERAMGRLENRDVIRRQRALPWRRASSRTFAEGIARVTT